jgi:dihydrofolate synthase/folylpolyglutamate synthase
MVFMPHWPQLLGNKPIDLGLERVTQLLAAMGNPHLHLPPVIHVAGTNGKGSTIAFLRKILESAGYKVHVYTSPHLLNFNERIVLAGNIISDTELFQLMEECRMVADHTKIPVTFFEGTTVAAFLAFSRIPADIVLLETGLGGRLDATNVVPNPALTIITSIAYDHMEYLGPTLPLIAGEKAGIMKPNTLCITSLQTEEVDETLDFHASNLPCPLYGFGYDWHVEAHPQGMLFYDNHTKEETIYPTPSLVGHHQIVNSGNAICAAKKLTEAGIAQITDEAIAYGISHAHWPARMQKLESGRLVSLLSNQEWELWIDGAHNEAGAYVLSQSLELMPKKPLYLIYGMTKGRDLQKFLHHFKIFDPIITGVLIETEPSAYPAHYIASEAKNTGFQSLTAESIDAAVRNIANNYPPGRILFTGSLYLASDVFKTNQSLLTIC